MILSAAQIVQVAQQAGFSGQGLVNAVAVALAESGGDPGQTYTDAPGSVDRGLWQINSFYHPEVTDAQAFDPAQAAVAAYRISAGGTDWTPWATWTNRRYRLFLSQAQQAVGGAGRAPATAASPAASGGAAKVAAVVAVAAFAYAAFS